MKNEVIKIEKNIPIPTRGKFTSINSYRSRCIEILTELNVGESIKIEDRTLDTVKRTWLWKAERKSGFKYSIRSIDHNTQRVWRIK